MAHLVDELNLPGFDFYAWDARGHGQSPGARGDAPSFGWMVRDVDSFVSHVRATFDLKEPDIAIIAQSVGAVVTSAWVHDYAPRIRCQVLASPAFRVKLYVPFALPGLRLLYTWRGNFFVNSYVKSKFLTHDIERQKSFDTDPLISRSISVNILLGLYDGAKRVVADAQAITTPTQLLISGSDWVVRQEPQDQFFARLGATKKEKNVLPGFYHDTLGEKDRAKAVNLVRDFIMRRFDTAPEEIDLTESDKSGFTYEEARKLSEPLAPLSPKGLFWGFYKFTLSLTGKLSDGIKLGQTTGFDSGSSLDYVYRNQPSGKGPIGRAIDRNYLNSVGWRGVRDRKIMVEAMLKMAIEALAQQNRPVRIVDIAAGHGRYVLDGIQNCKRPDSILLRDYKDLNVKSGTDLIASMGLADIARFEKGDAFNRESLAAITPKATIGIASGLYELFPNNEMVATSLAGLHDAIEENGYLIYTNQPWHPQLELIARALTNHQSGTAWVMRRRTQIELEQLARAAGFEKVKRDVEDMGIFSVSLMRRI
jgi:alpha-beta hydrolase superfamily lysophospholipase